MVRHGVAIFGLGRAGSIHMGNLIASHRCKILYIIDMEVENVERRMKELNQDDVKVLLPKDGETAYSDPNVAAVIVSSPTFTHEDIVRKALRHGKAVFCEKPIGQNEVATKACYEEADKAGKPLLCSFNRRFDPSIAALRERVRAGECGKIYTVKTASRDHPLPSMSYLKISGGIFHDCAVHDLDMVCWILGEYPTEVYTQAHCHMKEIAELEDVDTVVIVMKFKSNIIATLDLSRLASYGYDQRLEVFGTEGMLISENQRPNNLNKYTVTGCSQDKMCHSFPERYADSYVLAIKHFFNVMDGTEKLSISKHNTLRISELATACEESYKLGKPVQIPASDGDVMNGAACGDIMNGKAVKRKEGSAVEANDAKRICTADA